MNLLPLAAEMTAGFTLFGVIIVGLCAEPDAACPKSVFCDAAAATPAAAVVRTKSRRLSFLFMMASLRELY